MQQIKILSNCMPIIRQTFLPAFGSTNNNNSIQFFYLADYQNKIYCIPFIDIDSSFQYIINYYKKVIDYIDSQQHELIIKSIITDKIIDLSQRLQLYKQEIQDTSHCYFIIYEQLITQNSELMKQKNKAKVKKVLQQIEYKKERFYSEEDLYEIIVMQNLKSISIKVNPQETIEQVKCQISKQLAIDLNSFTLFFNNKRLQNLQATLQHYSIKKNDKLFMIYILKSGCFSSQSSIQINSKEYKNIKELKTGDSIWSYNQRKGIFQQDFIETIHKTSLDYYIRILFEDKLTIQCSPTHKFLTNNFQWKCFSSQEANSNNRLKSGDRIINFEKKAIMILNIQSILLKKPEVFYHISVQNNHTFILNTFISHNTQIRILNMRDGVEFMIDTNEKETINDIKKKIFQYNSKYQVNEQMLFLGSKNLKDKQSLTDYQLDYKNITLRLVIQSKQKIIIHFISQKKEYEFDLVKKQTIKELKKRISQKFGISVTHQILFVSNLQLQNHKSLQHYPLEENYNRITLIEVQNDQITQTNSQRFQTNAEMIIRIKENHSIKVKYITFKEMKVKQFIYCMLKTSNDSYSLMFGQHVLNPNDRLYSIQKFPFYTQQKLQGQIIKNYGRVSFYNYFVINQPFDESKMPNITNKEEQSMIKKALLVQNELREKININSLNMNFINFETFYKSIMYFTCESVFQKLSQFLREFTFQDKQNAKYMKGFNYCSILTRSLMCLPRYIGVTHKVINNFRLSAYHSVSELFYWNQFVPTFTDENECNTLAKQYTLFHIQSLTGRQISLISLKEQKQVVFLPYCCFYIQQIRVGQKFDEVWLIQLPTPLSFQKNIILSVDDVPNSKDNLKLVKKLQQKSFQVIQLINTYVSVAWMKQFGWFLKWKNINYKIISDMVRQQKDKGANYYAGIDLLQCFYNINGFTTPIIIYCTNIQDAQQNIIQRNINPNRIALVTKKLKQVDQFCNSK